PLRSCEHLPRPVALAPHQPLIVPSQQPQTRSLLPLTLYAGNDRLVFDNFASGQNQSRYAASGGRTVHRNEIDSASPHSLSRLIEGIPHGLEQWSGGGPSPVPLPCSGGPSDGVRCKQGVSIVRVHGCLLGSRPRAGGLFRGLKPARVRPCLSYVSHPCAQG